MEMGNFQTSHGLVFHKRRTAFSQWILFGFFPSATTGDFHDEKSLQIEVMGWVNFGQGPGGEMLGIDLVMEYDI